MDVSGLDDAGLDHTVGERAARPDVAASPRTVVKVGSSSLTTRDGAIDDARIAALVRAIADRVRGGHQVLLVSSGAIATGLGPLGLPEQEQPPVPGLLLIVLLGPPIGRPADRG